MLNYFRDEKTQAAFNSELFIKLDHVNISSNDGHFEKTQVEHKEPIFVRFSNLQYAILQKLKLCYNFSSNFSDVFYLEELELDTD